MTLRSSLGSGPAHPTVLAANSENCILSHNTFCRNPMLLLQVLLSVYVKPKHQTSVFFFVKQETSKTQEAQQNAQKKQTTPSRKKNQKQLPPVTKSIPTKQPSTRQVKHTQQHAAKFVNMTSHPRKMTTIRPGKYCELFEQEDECNSDRDCSWCNILDECVGRNKEDFRYCSGDKRNMEIDDMSQGKCIPWPY